jgi:hypothetical protein
LDPIVAASKIECSFHRLHGDALCEGALYEQRLAILAAIVLVKPFRPVDFFDTVILVFPIVCTMMNQVPIDEAHKQRISYEIVVAVYDDYEVASSWYAYRKDPNSVKVNDCTN